MLTKLSACLMTDLSETVIYDDLRRTVFGYTIWKKVVEEIITETVLELDRHKQLRTGQVRHIQDTLKQYRRLLTFMNEHGLDVIFTDQETNT